MKTVVPFLIAETFLVAAFIAALMVNQKQSIRATSTISEVSASNNITWFCLAIACTVSCVWLLTHRPSVFALVLACVILAAVITIRPNEASLDVHAAFVLIGILMVDYAFISQQMYVPAILTTILLVADITAKVSKKYRATLFLEYPLLGILLYGLFFLA